MGPPKQDLFIKSCVFILTCLKFSHLQSTVHLMQYTHQDIFSTAQNSFWTCQFWCLLVLLLFFKLFIYFFAPYTSAMFPSEDFFHQGNEKRVARGEMGRIQRVRHGSQAILCQKPPNTQCSVSRWALKSPMVKWANALKESSKKFHWSWTHHHQPVR